MIVIELNNGPWSAIPAFAAVIAAIEAFAAIVTTKSQLNVLRRSIELSAFERIIEKFGVDELREARSELYEEFKQDNSPDSSYLDPLGDIKAKPVDLSLESDSKLTFTSAGKVMVALDRVGFIVNNGPIFADEKLVRFIDRPVRNMLKILSPLVQSRRALLPDPTYMGYFEEFAKECEKEFDVITQPPERQS